MTLSECCELAQDIARVPITILQTTVGRAEFAHSINSTPYRNIFFPIGSSFS